MREEISFMLSFFVLASVVIALLCTIISWAGLAAAPSAYSFKASAFCRRMSISSSIFFFLLARSWIASCFLFLLSPSSDISASFFFNSIASLHFCHALPQDTNISLLTTFFLFTNWQRSLLATRFPYNRFSTVTSLFNKKPRSTSAWPWLGVKTIFKTFFKAETLSKLQIWK